MSSERVIDVTLEGFYDWRCDPLCIMVSPVLYQAEDLMACSVDQLVEEYAIWVGMGETWPADTDLLPERVQRGLAIAKTGRRPEFEYWKRVIRIFPDDDDRVYEVLEAVGDVHEGSMP